MHPAWRGRDVLRLEHFGAIHYARATGGMELFEPAFASLLAGAAERHIMDVWRDDPRGIELEELIVEVARLQDTGVLDEAYRSRARVVRGSAGSGASALGAPLVTNIQLTRACNLSCDHCFVDVETKPHPRELSLAQLEGLFAELSGAGAPLVLLAGGEPMLRPDFWEIVEASTRWDLDAALCTNATLIRGPSVAERLAASGVKWFSISLDGPDAETHDRLRGRGAFARACAGVRALLDAGARGVKLRVTVTSENADTLASFATIARELAVPEIVFKPFRHTTSGAALTSTHLYITRERYNRAIERAQEAWPSDAPRALWDDGMPETLPAWTGVTPQFGCVGGTTHASVIYDGRVVACDAVFDDRDWTLHDHPFLECWRASPTLTSWRHLDPTGECPDCHNYTRCGGGCRARALAAGLPMGAPDPWSYCEQPLRPPILRVLH